MEFGRQRDLGRGERDKMWNSVDRGIWGAAKCTVSAIDQIVVDFSAERRRAFVSGIEVVAE